MPHSQRDTRKDGVLLIISVSKKHLLLASISSVHLLASISSVHVSEDDKESDSNTYSNIVAKGTLNIEITIVSMNINCTKRFDNVTRQLLKREQKS
jgi:hypothetical protein